MDITDQQIFYVNLARDLRLRHGIHSRPYDGDTPGVKPHLRVSAHHSEIAFYLPSSYDYSVGDHVAAIQWTQYTDGDFLDGELYHHMPGVQEVAVKMAEFYAEATRRGLDGKL